MKLDEATRILSEKVKNSYGVEPEIKWQMFEGKGPRAKYCVIESKPYEPLIAVYNPKFGLRLYDIVSLCKDGEWRDLP